MCGQLTRIIVIIIIQEIAMFQFLWKKTPKQFNLNNSYLTIQFLTVQQKVQKDKILPKLQSEYQNKLDTIISYSSCFRYSYRYTLFSNTIKNKILLAEVMAILDTSNDEEFRCWYQANLEKIKLYMMDGKIINGEDVVPLFNQRDISLYCAGEVLEIVYQQKSLFNRIKVKAKRVVKNIPKTIYSILSQFVTILLKSMGLGSINSVISSFVPFKMIVRWVLNILMIVFPALAPLIGLSKLVI